MRDSGAIVGTGAGNPSELLGGARSTPSTELSDASGLGPWPSLTGHHVEILNEVHAGGIIQDVRVTSKGHMNIRVQESPAKVVTVRTQYEDV